MLTFFNPIFFNPTLFILAFFIGGFSHWMIPSPLARGLYNLVRSARQVAARQNNTFWFSFFVYRVNAGKRARFVEMK